MMCSHPEALYFLPAFATNHSPVATPAGIHEVYELQKHRAEIMPLLHFHFSLAFVDFTSHQKEHKTNKSLRDISAPHSPKDDVSFQQLLPEWLTQR